MTNEELIENLRKSDEALKDLSWETVRKIRNANGGLYPINWDKIISNWNEEKYGTLDISSKKEFETKLKALCDSLYSWKLYEPCPKCKNGIRIPVYFFTQYTPFVDVLIFRIVIFVFIEMEIKTSYNVHSVY